MLLIFRKPCYLEEFIHSPQQQIKWVTLYKVHDCMQQPTYMLNVPTHSLPLSHCLVEQTPVHTLIYLANSLPLCVYTQVAISYGYGSVRWGADPYNAVYIPDALFTLGEDESQ